MRRVRVDLHFTGLACRLAGRLPLLSRLRWDALVLAAIEGEHRTFDLAGDVDRVLRRQLPGGAIHAVPRYSGFQIRVVGGIEPSLPSTPAEAGDGELCRVGLAGRFGIGLGGVEGRH